MRSGRRRSSLWSGIHQRFIEGTGRAATSRALPAALALLVLLAPLAAAAFALPAVRREAQVEGTAVTVMAYPDVEVGIGWSGVSAQVVTDLDLGDLQRKLPAILKAAARQERCGERVTVSEVASGPAPPAASLTGQVRYERWSCAEHAKGGAGEPHLVARAAAKVCLDLTPRIEANRLLLTARVRCLEPEAGTGQGVDKERLAGTLEQLADRTLAQALGQEDLTTLLPDELRPYHPELTGAGFTELAGGALGLRLEGTLRAGAADLTALARRAVGG